MPYSLRTYDGTSLVTIADGLVDDQVTTPLFLIGKNVTGYGTRQNENFLYLLENFAGVNPPSVPQQGQLWFDKTPSATKLNVFDGANWKGLTVGAVSTSQPTTLTIGDLWFDSDKSQLWAKSGTGTSFTLIGPDVLTGYGITKMVPKAVHDINSGTHVVLDITINDEILGIISQDSFSVGGNQDEFTAGFTNIVRGITLRPGATLSGLDIPSRTVNETIDTQWNFSSGIKLGRQTSVTYDTNGNLSLNAPSTNLILNSLNIVPASVNASIGTASQPFSEIVASNISSGSSIRPLSIEGDVVLYTNGKLRPYLDNNIALGTSVGRWSNVYTYGISAGGPTSNGTLEGDWIVESGGAITTPTLNATNFSAGNTPSHGNVTGQWVINVGSTWQATHLLDANFNPVVADVNATNNTIAQRDTAGRLFATQFDGPLFGNVTGNVVGNLTGNVTGNVVGDVAGNLTGSAVTATTVRATNFYGYLQGPVTGNVVGNVTGNLSGNVTGDLSGNTYGTHQGPVVGNVQGTLVGNVVGPVQGNVTGNLTGNSAGTHTGPVTGNVTGNTAGTHTGPVYGNVVGNLVGAVTGNVTGNLTGNVAGNVVASQVLIGRSSSGYPLDVNGDIHCSILHGTATDSQLWGGSNKFVSTSPPTNDQGADGDFWFQREA